jgi:2-polyprenyl-3-methyl-5-hydroxy-6-metoxy-1,4-benzoquinol methylase
MDFSVRSSQKEWLDRQDIPLEDIRRNMVELDVINRRLGGHRATIRGIRALAGERNKVRVCEIGCGGGDNLIALSNWCFRHHIETDLVGVDINPSCIAVAAIQCQHIGARFMVSDFRDAEISRSTTDIIFCSLFCHHFSDDDIVGMLHWMQSRSAVGFFINDIHRHPLAYWSIRVLTRLFSRSRLVKNDAPLSVLRAFTAGEWVRLLNTAGIHNYKIRWNWAFRWLIIVKSGH